MSRTHKTDRARQARVPEKKWRKAYGKSLKETTGDYGTAEGTARWRQARLAAEQAVADLGVDYDPHQTRAQDDDWRTGGVRYGNQRKMRARADQMARRADRKRDPDPILDAQGEIELENRPQSPARRRGMRWT